MIARSGRRRFPAILAVILFCASSCSHPQTVAKSPVGNEGRAVLYIQPLPREAHRIRFAIESISAFREDGKEIPLSPAYRDIGAAGSPGPQRILASGFLPDGRYKGISVKIVKASLVREEGEAALLVPEDPVVAEQAFDVRQKRTVALFLTLLPSRLLSEGIGFTPTFTLAVSARPLVDLTGLVTNPGSGTVTVFDKKRLQVTGFISTDRTPMGIVLDQAGRKAYVANSLGNSVEILDVFSGERIARIPFKIGDSPRELGIAPDGRTLVSANYGTGTASIIDTNSQIETGRVKVGEGPTGVVVDRRGLRAYLMNSLSNTISVIDLAQKEILTNISVEGGPLKGSLNRAGDRLYVICRYSPDLLILDPVKLTRVGKIYVGTGSTSLKVDTQTDLIFVGNEFAGEISILDPFSLLAIDRINVRGVPSSMTIDREEGMLLVVNGSRGKIQKVNLVGREVVSEMEIGGGAHEIAVMGER
jgi:YVTN family beta-propeller protein